MKKYSKAEGIKKVNQSPAFGIKDIIAILLLICVYPIGLIFMWLTTKWPKRIKLLITLPVVFAIIAMSLAIFFIYKLTASNELPTQLPKEDVICTQEVKLCPDGETYVGRKSPSCEFTPCPQAKVRDLPAMQEVNEPPESSIVDPGELLPTASIEKE